jgi:NitT/TauT family transport system permease protein
MIDQHAVTILERRQVGAVAGPAKAAAPGGTARRPERRRQRVLGAVGVGLFLCLWQLVAVAGWVNPLFLPSFTAVVARMVELFRSGDIYPHLFFSLKNFALGVVIAITLAVPLGVAMGWYRTLRDLLDPLVGALYVVPFVALTPLIILAFGIWDASKVVMVVIAAFFPIVINTAAGMRNADRSLTEMARSFGARPREVMWHVAVPNAVPSILAGIRLGVGRGLIGIFVAELISSPRGLGYLMIRSSQLFDTETMLVPVLIVSILGVVLTGLLHWVEARFDGWRPTHA